MERATLVASIGECSRDADCAYCIQSVCILDYLSLNAFHFRLYPDPFKRNVVNNMNNLFHCLFVNPHFFEPQSSNFSANGIVATVKFEICNIMEERSELNDK